MEISRRLFILLVSTVIGFMFALVAAVAVLVVRGPAGQVASAHAASQAVGAVAIESEEDLGQNRLAAMDVGFEEEEPVQKEEGVREEGAVEDAAEPADEAPVQKGLEGLSPETRALFAQAGDDEEGEDDESNEEDPQPDPVAPEPTAQENAVVPEGQVEAGEVAEPEAPANPAPETENLAPAQVAAPAAAAPAAAAPAAAAPAAAPVAAPAPTPASPRGSDGAVRETLRPRPGDADGDGVSDRDDQCATAPEDKDGFLDGDGCPDLDNDEDGIADTQDLCPLEKETVNGNEDEDGCPDEAKPKAVAAPTVVAPTAANGKTWSVYFGHMKWALSRTEKKRVRRSIRGIGKGHNRPAVYIQGHADGAGNIRVNRWYANKRAKSVRKYLVAKGVPGTRIQILDAVVGDPKTSSRDKASRRVDIFLAK